MDINSTEYRVDDLQVNGLKILQNPKGYCFTTDAVILANFVKVKRGEKIVDLGSGSGIIPILLAGKYGATQVYGIELQENLHKMSCKSVELNNLGDKIKMILSPMQQAHTILGVHEMDIVVCNPPYTKAGDGKSNLDRHIAICRHEIEVNLGEVIESAARLLKFGGRLYMVHQCERLSDIFRHMHIHRLEPKVIRLVQGKDGLKPTLVLIEAHSNGKPGMIVQNNLVLYDVDGKPTLELDEMYSRR